MVQRTVSCLEPHHMPGQGMAGDLAFSAHPGATYPPNNATTGRDRHAPGMRTRSGQIPGFAPGSGASSGAGNTYSGVPTVFQPVSASSPLLQRFYLAQEGETAGAGSLTAGTRVEIHGLTAAEGGGDSLDARSRDAALARMRSLMLGSRQGTVHEKQMPETKPCEPTDWEQDGECADGERMAEWLDSQMQLIPEHTIKASLEHALAPAPPRPSRISFDRETTDNSSPARLADMRYAWLGSRQGSVAGAPRRRVSFDQAQGAEMSFEQAQGAGMSLRRWRRLCKTASQEMSEAQQEALMERRRAFLGSRHGSRSWRVSEAGAPQEDKACASQGTATYEEVAC